MLTNATFNHRPQSKPYWIHVICGCTNFDSSDDRNNDDHEAEGEDCCYCQLLLSVCMKTMEERQE